MGRSGAGTALRLFPSWIKLTGLSRCHALKIVLLEPDFRSLYGAWRAEHTGNSTVAEIVIEGMWERRNATLRRITRHMKKASAVRTVELWSLASLADVVIDQSGDEESGRNLEPFEIAFLRSLFRLVERDCESRERGA
jgi:hypothetical protein